jgi:hypothetical protein
MLCTLLSSPLLSQDSVVTSSSSSTATSTSSSTHVAESDTDWIEIPTDRRKKEAADVDPEAEFQVSRFLVLFIRSLFLSHFCGCFYFRFLINILPSYSVTTSSFHHHILCIHQHHVTSHHITPQHITLHHITSHHITLIVFSSLHFSGRPPRPSSVYSCRGRSNNPCGHSPL